jgi:hypothetical protein
MLTYTKGTLQIFDWTVTLRSTPPNPGVDVQLSTTYAAAFDIFPNHATVFGNPTGPFFTEFLAGFIGTVGVGAYNDGGSYAALATHGGGVGRFPIAVTQVGSVNSEGIVKIKLKLKNPYRAPATAYLSYVPAAAFATPSGNINPPTITISGPTGFVSVQLAQSLYPGSRVAIGCLYQGATSATIVHN